MTMVIEPVDRVNDRMARDSFTGCLDSTGAITGNIQGLLPGFRAITARWLEELELRAEIEAPAGDMFEIDDDSQEW